MTNKMAQAYYRWLGVVQALFLTWYLLQVPKSLRTPPLLLQ